MRIGGATKPEGFSLINRSYNETRNKHSKPDLMH